MFLYQPSDGYCYNSDSIFLYDFISSFSPKGALLDVGCGVGILSLLLTRDFKTQTTIIDKQEKMLAYATHNFALNGLGVQSHLGDFIEVAIEEKFDTIISNPPFYDSNVQQSENTHLNIARYAHHLPLEKFIAKVKKQLKPRGYFIFCYDAKQVDVVMYYLSMYGIKVETIQFVHSKEERDSKLVMIAARNGSKSMVKVLPPLVVFDANNLYTPQAQHAFDRAGTHSIKGEIHAIIE
ncbi:MAG: hypothetical protein RLZZ428_170 [Pseudomonadota bacterium]